MKKKLIFIIPLIIFVVLAVVFVSDIIDIWPQLTSGSEEALVDALEGLGWRGAIILLLIQAALVLVVFIPSEFVQIASGMTYGIWRGALINISGILLGATIIYILVNLFKVSADVENSAAYDTISAMKKKSYSPAKLTLVLFLLPAIPYGMICYFASAQDLKYWRYAIVCIIGNLPSVLIDSLLGKAFTTIISRYMGWLFVGILAFTIIMLIIINKINTRRTNKLLYGEPNPTFAKVMECRKAHRPDETTYRLLYNLVAKHYRRRNNVKIYNEETKDIKEPCLYLSAHPSWPDFLYTMLAVYPKIPNIVVNNYYFYKPLLRRYFLKMGNIPKKMFTTDSRALKDMLNVARSGGSLMMMPEGRLSIYGTNLPMPLGLEKLIQKLDMNVVTIIPHGAYLTSGKWVRSRRKGRVDVETRLTIRKEELQNLSLDQIKDKIERDLAFDDFEWAKEHKVEFKGKSLCKGVENILYRCPYCDSKYTIRGIRNRIECTHCGSVVNMNKQYEFTDPPHEDIHNIRDWYHWQQRVELENISNINYTLATEVVVKTYAKNGRGLVKAGEGVCVLSHLGLKYQGTFEGKLVEEMMPIDEIPTLLFGCNEDFELYHNGTFYFFIPKVNKLQCVEWALVSELLHNEHTEKEV